MKINKDQSILLYNAVSSANDQAIKQLSQKDRRIVLIALRHIRQGLISDNSSTLKPDKINKIVSNLQNVQKKPVLNKYQKIIKFFQLLFGVRSNKILNERNKTAIEIKKNQEEYDAIPNKISKAKNNLGEWIEMVNFCQKEAYPIYKNIEKFYETLPREKDLAKPLLKIKVDEIEGVLKKAKEDERDKSYIKILEKEVLKSLKNLYKYEQPIDDKQKNNFKLEVDVSQTAFAKSATFAKDQSVAKKEISKLEKEITNFENRKKELEKRISISTQKNEI